MAISKEQSDSILRSVAESAADYQAAREAAIQAKKGLPRLEAAQATARGVWKQARAVALENGVKLPKTQRDAATAEEAEAD